jgi:lipoprotein-anchoring transpeptidase ErfK/SrfK
MNTITTSAAPRTLRRRTVPVVLGLLTLVAAGACGRSPSAAGDTGTAIVDPAPTSADHNDGTVAPPPTTSLNARIKAPLAVRSEPSASAATITTLKATTPFGSPTTVLVLDERDGWLQVSLPVRPNGATGWVPRDAVEMRANQLAITVDRGQHHLVLTRDGQVELEAPVADGTSENPTPPGAFYVTDIIETDSAAGAYGPFAFGLSGHSETLSEFGGGDGQLGLHGTNDPKSIGTSVSHGCVRVTNDIITRLVKAVPLGTPVTVV